MLIFSKIKVAKFRKTLNFWTVLVIEKNFLVGWGFELGLYLQRRDSTD
jgi:hypothetical protein